MQGGWFLVGTSYLLGLLLRTHYVISQNPGPHETITDIISKGLFIDMRHYIQGLQLFEEVKVSEVENYFKVVGVDQLPIR